jgi:transposase-like protein
VSGLDHTFKPNSPVRRIELISGVGGRRRWSAGEKAAIVEETLAPGAVVSEVARRHGLRRRTALKVIFESNHVSFRWTSAHDEALLTLAAENRGPRLGARPSTP